MNRGHYKDVVVALFTDRSEVGAHFKSHTETSKEIECTLICFANIDSFRVDNQSGISVLVVDANSSIYSPKTISRLKKNNPEMPIIVFMDEKSQNLVLEAFEYGCDDSISLENIYELCYRISAILNRQNAKAPNIQMYKDLFIREDRVVTNRLGKSVELTHMEYELLVTFIKNINTALSRGTLLDMIWTKDVHQNSVNVAVNRLKTKLRNICPEFDIKTIRGMGYMIN